MKAFKTPLNIAIKCKRFEAVETLLSLGALANSASINLAVEKKNKDLVDLLLSYETDVTEAFSRGETLAYVAMSGDYEMTKFVLERGADINVQFSFTYNLRHGYRYKGSILMGLFGIHNEFDPCNTASRTRFKNLAKKIPPIINLILNNNPDMNIKDRSGRTVLVHAADSFWLMSHTNVCYNIIERVVRMSQGIDDVEQQAKLALDNFYNEYNKSEYSRRGSKLVKQVLLGQN